ncbi:MAG: ribosome silencing factor [Elusimicrobia bacterium RIFOXYA12_FULL_51_18]|nr:MAG: ribosome silencing factor [Elusimicrobia bacterium RIFOXYA12_FULL_51_18]OGS30618.1 MAG: ribosome silencing factor [Elusimicrobia bacterium RIFOXYA2_FULL_53_38]
MTDNQPVQQKLKKIAIAAARLADAKKAEAVAVYDMDGRSALADYVVVATVDNPAQLDAVDEEISINLKKEGLYALYRDGMRSKNWKVLDYGGIIVHIFERKAREFYSFDKVYTGYSEIKWREKPIPSLKKTEPKAARKKAAPKAAVKKTGKPAAKKAPARKTKAGKAVSKKAAPKKKISKKKK